MKEQILSIIENTTTHIKDEGYCIRNKDLIKLAEELDALFAKRIVSSTFKDKVKKDIKGLEQDLQELEQDLEFAYTDIEGWSYKTSIVKGAINALVKTLNYC